MIMSAFLLVRNVLMRPPKGGHVEEDGDERRRTEAGGGAGASGERRAAFGGCGSADGPELPADGTGVEAILRGRRDGAEAPQRGATVEPGVRRKFSAQDPEAGAREIWRAGGRTLRSHASGRALGWGGRARGGCRDAAALDAGGRVMEPGTKEAATPETAGAQGALWGDGTDGRELSPLAGGARPGRMPDGPGRRRHEHHAGTLGRGGDDLGGSRGAAGLDRAVRGAAKALRGLEEPLQAFGQRAGAGARGRADHAVWAHVHEAGDRTDRGQLAAGQRASGADARDAPGPAGEEVAAGADRQPRRGQCVSGDGISARAQSALCAPRREARGLPPSSPGRGEAGPDLSSGERAGD